MWSRVFGRRDAPPDFAALLAFLQRLVPEPVARLRGDDLGWTGAELTIECGATPIYIERYDTTADDLRDDLNTWAAWLETQDHDAKHGMLMERVIAARQMVTIRRPLDHANEVVMDRICTAVCQWLAVQTGGVYQVDGQGFFAADGTLLLQEY